MTRQRVEAGIFFVIAESTLFNQAWSFYNQRPDLSSLTTTIVLFTPYAVGALYVSYRLLTWPAKQSILTAPITPMTIAIGEYEARPTAENAAKVKRLLDIDLTKNEQQ